MGMGSYPQLRLSIGGRWIDRTSLGHIDVENPADGKLLGHLPVAGRTELDAALEAAHEGFRG